MAAPKKAYCPSCKKETELQKEESNLALNLFLTVCSLGLWLPIWLAIVLMPKQQVCSVCQKLIPPPAAASPKPGGNQAA